MDTRSDFGSAALWRASQEIVGIASAEGGMRNCERQSVTAQQLALLRHGIEAQLRWALVHGGDQELIDLLQHRSGSLR
jgi:hypothetical protein